eukprot:2413158-Alexandrium_andersonii.AAC.1
MSWVAGATAYAITARSNSKLLEPAGTFWNRCGPSAVSPSVPFRTGGGCSVLVRAAQHRDGP